MLEWITQEFHSGCTVVTSQPDIKLIVVLLVADTDQHGILLSDPVWQTDPADRIWSSSCR